MSRNNSEDVLMDDVLYRPARTGDVPEMADLFLKSVADMYARNSVEAAMPPRPAVIHAYEHILSTGDFHLAESQGRIIAIAGSVMRDGIWFLSAFWARPGLQRQKIGMPLLKQVWSAGERGGAEIFCTWSSIDLTAMACYMKKGMKPAYEILLFGGTPKSIPAVPSGYEFAPLEKVEAMELDRIVRGTRREVDHDLWAGSPGFKGRRVLRKGKCVGYYYINGGSIGPAAWSEQDAAAAVMSFACKEAADTSTEIRFAVPGINHSALEFALESGLRLTSFAHFLTTKPFGCMEQYLPSGPSLY
jgi:hypothetical protein